MIVYSGIKSDFMTSVDNDTIAKEIEYTMMVKMKRHTVSNEFRAWENSLLHMSKVLRDAEIPDNAGIAIEYNIPQTSKRVDFIISGYNQAKQSNAVIIELKQWQKVESVDSVKALVKTYTGGANRLVVHPSYQVWSYAKMIEDYNQNVQEKDIKLSPCAYMHNYERSKNDPIDEKRYEAYLEEAPVFAKGDVAALREFIKRNIKLGDNREVLYEIDHGKIKPSKSLQNSIKSMLNGNREFILLDDQKVVYEQILRISQKCQKEGKKRTIIVEGGPGTGKTVLAINLLSELTNNGQFVQYVSKNSAPRNVYATKLKGAFKKSSIDNMFKGSGIYTETPANTVNTILTDEAHRLNLKSGMFKNKGENQIKEIINASRCSVFFIDESQRVTVEDIGSVAEIERCAELMDSEVIKMQLNSQFRCNGSDGYLAWLDNVLEIRETANYDIDGLGYEIKVMESPEDVRDAIFEKNKIANKSRILAGYCWDWITEGKNNPNVCDIRIGDFAMSWNLGDSTTYAIDENSVNQIGCIHTSQGLEFDYVGVIIGNDMRYENGHIVTDFTKRAKTDKSIFGMKGMYKKNPEETLKLADEIIKNTYRTLMTRGMKGCYIYCCDKALGAYLKERL